MRPLQIVFILLATCTCARAEPPSWEQMFPMGGQRGKVVDVDIKGKLGDMPLRIWCSHPGLVWEKVDLPSSSAVGEKKESDTANTKLRVTIAADAQPGIAYVRLVNDDGVSTMKPFCVGNIEEVNEVEPNDLTGEAMQVATTPLLINGLLGKREDVDHVRIAVQAGETLIASVQAERGLRSEADASLQFVDERGNVLAQNLDFHGLDPQLVWTADRDRLIVLRVFGFPAEPNSTIGLAGGDNFHYRLTVTTGPWCEGVLPLAVSRPEATKLHLVGWNLASVDTPTVDFSGNDRPNDDESKSNDAFHVFSINGVPGNFALPVVDVPIILADGANSNVTSKPKQPQQIVIPAVICGNIDEKGQVDAFEFSAVKDSKLTIAIESQQLGYPLDGYLTIQDVASGKLLAEVDDAGARADPELQWTVPEDGRYRILVKDTNASAGPSNLYRLMIKPQVPSYRATTVETAFAGKVGESFEIPIKIERQFGYDQRLRVELDKSIDGLECEPMVSEPSGESATEVKLKLTVSKPQVYGIRIKVSLLDRPQEFKMVVDSNGVRDVWVVAKEQ